MFRQIADGQRRAADTLFDEAIALAAASAYGNEREAAFRDVANAQTSATCSIERAWS